MAPPAAPLPLVESQADAAHVPELVVISGKGGTGKTSVVGSFAALADNLVLADCDVDAADLHLVLAPEIRERNLFVGGHEARVREADCTACRVCREVCRFDAIGCDPDTGICTVDPIACEGCGVCVEQCPEQAIDFPARTCGEWFVSSTASGPMVHARLGIAAENSGKLVTLVRREAKRIAATSGRAGILVDGPPGVGCPVIAALSGATRVLVVTEPTVSGEHDLERVLQLVKHFGIPAAVCVNRWDIHPEGTARIEDRAREHGVTLFAKIRYDTAVTSAQVQGRPVVELGGPAADDIRELWERVEAWWDGGEPPPTQPEVRK
ncbi:MAG: ATP-binding protein [Acidobacteria bacterium]|nr:ATP-binding protein [Acidobacteriota bacterium]